MIKKLLFSILLILLLALTALPGLAQEDTPLTLNLSRDFGYSSGTGDIQGTFSMKVGGPDDLARVVFLIDGEPIGEDSEAPFALQFNTGSYAMGEHTLSATGYTTDGRELQSNVYKRVFVAAGEGMEAAGRIAIPILVIAFGSIILSLVFPLLTGRNKATLPAGTPRNYGMLGGAICPKCSRPFPMTIFGLKLLVGRLERCPHCGKYSLVRRAPLEVLRTAEAAEVQDAAAGQLQPLSDEEKLRKELNDSRFHDV